MCIFISDSEPFGSGGFGTGFMFLGRTSVLTLLFVWFYCYLLQRLILSPPLCLASLIVFFLVPEQQMETTVDENVNFIVLLNLLPGTEYNVQLTAVYPVGESEPLMVAAKTRKCPYTTLLVLLLLFNTLIDYVISLWGEKAILN